MSVSQSPSFFAGESQSEALVAALEAAKSDFTDPVEDPIFSSHGSCNDIANIDENGSSFARRRVAARRGRDRKKFIKTGKLCFTTQYFPDKKKLEVMVIRAFDLGRRKEHNELNPFLRLYLLPGKRQKQHTRVKRRTKEPYFNEKRFFYDLAQEDLTSNRLKLKAYSREAIAKNELLGEAEIALSSLSQTEKESFNVDLFIIKDEVCVLLL